MLHLKNNVRNIRQLSGLNQTDFGELIGVSQDVIVNFENRPPQKPNMVVVAKIAEVAGLKAEDLVNKDIPISKLNGNAIRNYKPSVDDVVDDAPKDGRIKTDGQPVYQVILNLSYSGRKMADANYINARSIEKLVNILAANLGVDPSVVALPGGIDMDDLPAEAFLNGQPLQASGKGKRGTGKKSSTSN